MFATTMCICRQRIHSGGRRAAWLYQEGRGCRCTERGQVFLPKRGLLFQWDRPFQVSLVRAPIFSSLLCLCKRTLFLEFYLG